MSLSPDGVRYLALAGGERVPRPFHFRWLAPSLLGTDEERWRRALIPTSIALALSGVQYAGWIALAAVGLTGLRINWRLPVLVDLHAMSWALIAANVARYDVRVAVCCALIAGCVKETSPVFAALYAWNPWLLLALAAPAVRALWKPGPDPLEQIAPGSLAVRALTHPILAAREAHAGRWFDPRLWVLPWGGLLAGFYAPTWQVGATLAAAYGQCLIATDTIRLYVWAWPALAAHAGDVVPVGWWPLLIVATVWNPFAGDGI